MKIGDDVLLLRSTTKMPLMKLPVTSVALRTSRGVVLIGPGNKTPAQENEIANLGRVTDVVAPNLLHHLSIHAAQKTFPQATVWGVEGFRTKRADVAWDKILNERTWTYHDEIRVIEIKGVPKINECVFFHLASKTLVVTDLFFHLTKAKGLGAWIILQLFGTYRKFGISKFYLRFAEDKSAFRKSLGEIAALDFVNIVMAHGEPVTSNARELFETALKERGLS